MSKKERQARWLAGKAKQRRAAALTALASDPLDVAALAEVGKIPSHAATALIAEHGITSLSKIASHTPEQIRGLYKVGEKGAGAISRVLAGQRR